MTHAARRILVTGAQGFIGKNLIVRLGELPSYEVLTYTREDSPERLAALVEASDAVVHLAGENRPLTEEAFEATNHGLTRVLCDAIRSHHQTTGRKLPLVLASSAQADQDNAYGRSKLAAELEAIRLSQETGSSVAIYRWPGVFGKWGRPNYNSVVATFCYNLARGLPVQIHNPDAMLRLVYVDDVISSILHTLQNPPQGYQTISVEPEYSISVGGLKKQIQAFEASRNELIIERVGTGLIRALYSTYLSYLPTDRFCYEIPQHSDQRGTFVEMLKTHDSGQFSFLTAHPGVTRGGHYHHTKTEKFLVLRGDALFKFRHLVTNETYEIRTDGLHPQIVETIPGWSHDVTNIGQEDLFIMLWANEIFDRANPDTIASKV